MSITKLFSPELKKLQNGTWYIEYYIPAATGKKRIRRAKDEAGNDLNRITDLRERERLAESMIKTIKKKITPVAMSPEMTTVVQALHEMVVLKRSSKETTNKTLAHHCRWFCDFLKLKGWEELQCVDLRYEHVQAFFDYQLLTLKVNNNTHNTRKNNLRCLFTELVRRQYIPENYVSRVETRPKIDPQRRALTNSEKQLIFKHAFTHDPALAYAMLLLGYCAIRPGEIRNLKVSSLQFDKGVIAFPASDSKNNKASYVTVPDAVLQKLLSFERHKAPGHYYVFGNQDKHKNLEPGPKRIGENTLAEKFRRLLDTLVKAGKLKNIKGVSLYSLKDTLAVYLLDAGVGVESAMRHFRHSDLGMFQRYVKRLGIINEPIKGLDIDIEV